MARKQTKELQKTASKAVQIKCCFCKIKQDCKRKERKEFYEKEGIITSCILTPNRPAKKRKKLFNL